MKKLIEKLLLLVATFLILYGAFKINWILGTIILCIYLYKVIKATDYADEI